MRVEREGNPSFFSRIRTWNTKVTKSFEFATLRLQFVEPHGVRERDLNPQIPRTRTLWLTTAPGVSFKALARYRCWQHARPPVLGHGPSQPRTLRPTFEILVDECRGVWWLRLVYREGGRTRSGKRWHLVSVQVIRGR